ncbi:MAG: PEPxxWA-CTERM sorting domain-containing protein [Pseudomonadota bacterium]
MRKMMIGLAALMAASSANAALIITYDDGAAALPTGLSIIENFDSYANGAALPGGTGAFAYTSTQPNIAARPNFNSTGGFGAVLGTAGSTWTINFAAKNAFSFDLGSLDTFNVLTLLYADGTSQILNGAQIALGATADGNQVLASSNGRVIYRVTDATPLIVGARFQSTGYSFEFDNLATGNIVPEPSTWAMMVLGFGIVGRAMRRRRKNAIASFA